MAKHIRGRTRAKRILSIPAGSNKNKCSMKTPSLFACALALFGTMLPLMAQITNSLPSTVADGANLEKLSGGFKFTEGATCDAQGNVFFTDQPNNRIMEWSTEGKLTTFLQPAGRANGMYFDAKGNLIACADEKTALWSIAPDKTVTVLVSDYQGKY